MKGWEGMGHKTWLPAILCLFLATSLTPSGGQRQRRYRINADGSHVRTSYENTDHLDKRFLEQTNDVASWGMWSAPGECSVACGDTGFAEKHRNCSTGVNADCGADGSKYWQVLICNNGPCTPAWSEWSSNPCSVTCGIGIITKLRTCNNGNITDCPGESWAVDICNEGSCSLTTTTPEPTTSIMAQWSSWTTAVACSSSCGSGFSQQTRTCSTGINSDCPGSSYVIKVCNLGPCAVDGVWSRWTPWSSCSASCGLGNETRSRTCDFPPGVTRGDDCVGAAIESQECDAGPCAVDGVWSQWNSWESCSRSCDTGVRLRTRNCTYPANALEGAPCSGIGAESQLCGTDPCPRDGLWAEWSQWSTCSKNCSGGTKLRARACAYEPGHPRGKACEGDSVEQASCNTQECPVDGKFSPWTSWTQCTRSCNNGIQQRQRACTYPLNVPRGKPCDGNTTEIRHCGLNECPVDGIWASWNQWSTCSKSCGSGLETRNRTCTYPSPTAPHGKDCQGHDMESKPCNANLCPVDGNWGIWGRYLPCSRTCGGGERIRFRTCQYDSAAPHGTACPGRSVEAKVCNNITCPVDGVFDAWSFWSICSQSCAGGVQTRRRNCHFPTNAPHGADCVGDRNQAQACNVSPCPTTTPAPTTTTLATADGKWSSWESWSACTVTCGSGTRERSRTCTWPDHTQHGLYCPGNINQTESCNTQHCPVDGSWANWQSWSRCSVSCENGTQTRIRTCDFDPRYPRGANCSGAMQETKDCHQGKCPVNGTWSAWTGWTACAVTCGSGTQVRQRTCEFPPNTPHGADCVGDNHQNQTCNNNTCPVDGTLTAWGLWSNCSATCGNGTRERYRSCSFPPNVPRGKNCTESLTDTEMCITNLCPVDGQWNSWSSWETCSTTCDKGRQSRHRTCVYDAVAPHGAACLGSPFETQRCKLAVCPVDGHWSSWGRWTACSASCGNGTRTRTHRCVFAKNKPHGQNCTGPDDDTEACFEGLCAVDGLWSDWGSWSPCNQSCGNGTTSRSRTCTFKPGYPQGQNCSGPGEETKVCNTNLCPVDGVFGDWGTWSTCTLSCGTGTQRRERNCTFDPVAPRGKDCNGLKVDARNCNTQLCPVNGFWSSWSNWTVCSKSCGSGAQYRTRKCQYLPAGAPQGADCVGLPSEQRSCNTDQCPVDGQWTAWGNWSACSKSCENGTRSRSRRCYYPPNVKQGNPCVGDEKQSEPCNTDLCPIAGHWSSWSGYSPCTVTCGNGTYTRNRSCIFHDPNPHGSKCFGPTEQTDACNTTPCPVDGTWSDWGNWTKCSASCAGGIHIRVRICDFPTGVPHGKNCTGNNTESMACNTGACPVDGVLTQWSPWTNCSQSCDNGTEVRFRACHFSPTAPRGKNCTGDLQEVRACNEGPCPVDGVWAQWAGWTTCNQTCGGGYQTRQRNCSYPAGVPQGNPCPGNATAERSCNNNLCPVDGVWSSWSNFSACSATCGSATSTRYRTCDYGQTGAPQGTPCNGTATENKPCNLTACVQDGVWGIWSNWGTCSATCNNGTQTRDRVCTWPSSNHGKNCTGASTETQTCSPNPCPVNGQWGHWKAWSACTASCDTGTKIRHRVCEFNGTGPHGADCQGTDQESSFCNILACTVDGVWTQWTNWGTCSVTCATGVQQRTRTCSYANPLAPKGKNCTGDSAETKPCTAPQNCPVDGVWQTWGSWSACSQSCEGGFQVRRRTCFFPLHAPQGDYCSGRGTGTQTCNTQNCTTTTP